MGVSISLQLFLVYQTPSTSSLSLDGYLTIGRKIVAGMMEPQNTCMPHQIVCTEIEFTDPPFY
jgi:hypothetical protein